MSTLATPTAITPPPPTVGTTSVQVALANLTRLGVYVFNASPTVTIWIAPLGAPASAAGVGSIAIQPLQGMFLGHPAMPPWTSGINAVAASGSGNVIGILEFNP